jgi:hypothetical protein
VISPVRTSSIMRSTRPAAGLTRHPAVG